MSNHVHVYVSQAHKGELVMGAGVDSYTRLRPARILPRDRAPDGGRRRTLPDLARAHVLRTWGGIVDTTLDASPIVGTTPVEYMFVNCGWGTGGFREPPRPA